MAPSFLHGMLHATIFEADSPKNPGRASGGVRKFLRKLVGDLKTTVGHGESYTQLYATIGLEEARSGRTRMIPDEPANRRWYETFRIYWAYLPVTEILVGEEVDRGLEICDEDWNPVGDAKIHVKVQYFDASRDRNWARSDIFDAISNAHHLIYMAGWSVHTEITLIRDSKRPKLGGGITLGELLKMKANEGVRVLMLLWDDRTSVGSLKKDGHMATHNEETANYLRNTTMYCAFCPRYPDDEPWHDIHSWLEGPFAWDVLFNFEQCWRKRGKDVLVQLQYLSHVIIPPSPVMFPEDRETWNVQLFRYIDGVSLYTDITQSLRAKGMEANPKDYLTFLGNREVKKSGEFEPEEHPQPHTDYSRAQEARRFLIYVHTKMMIVYYKYGSANINQRSMDGNRDSELAMGAYQPFRLTSSKLSYRVTYEGVVTQLPGMEFIPDTKARILGAKSDRLPPIITT
ncbi:unnamed protein product [Musa banksii]